MFSLGHQKVQLKLCHKWDCVKCDGSCYNKHNRWPDYSSITPSHGDTYINQIDTL